MTKKPNLLIGAIFGGLFMLPVLILAYWGQTTAELPFPPFDLFNIVPTVMTGPFLGGILTFGIDTLVNVITTFELGRLDEAAKIGEQALAIAMVFGIAALAAGGFTAIMNRVIKTRQEAIPGLVLGGITALPFILASLASNLTAQAEPLIAIIWVGALFLIWGAVVSWFYHAYVFQTRSATSDEQTMRVEGVDRRTFLVQVGAATAVVTVAGTALTQLLGDAFAPSAPTTSGGIAPSIAAGDLPNANDLVQPVPGTRPEVTPLAEHYRIDIRSDPNGLIIPEEGYALPFIDATTDRREIGRLTLEQIKTEFAPVEAFITMSCISNRIAGTLISTTKWTGAQMSEVLNRIGIPEGATHLKISSGDGFDETVAIATIMDDPRIILTYYWEDQPLTSRNGFPLRIHVPDRYGMKQPKWITEIAFISADEDGYWVRRGWDKEAIVQSTSVIDTVAIGNAYQDADGQWIIPIGGMAWAGDRGISRVEVQVDEGDWQEAQLRSAISDRTWQLWRYEWRFEAGNHRFGVRCYEGDGSAQSAIVMPVRPSGATGYHRLARTLSDAQLPTAIEDIADA